MSTVIWKDGILYADTQGSSDECVINDDGIEVPETISRTVKIFKEKDKLFGITGDINAWSDFKKRPWKRFCWDHKPFDFGLIMEWDGKKLTSWKLYQKKIFGFYFSIFKRLKLVVNKWAVMGSGQDFAIEALNSGLTPVEAIKYASDRDPWTNDEVMSLAL